MASTYLSRTPSSNGNSTTWTYSCWVKLSTPSTSSQQLLDVNDGTHSNSLRITPTGLRATNYNPSYAWNIRTNRLFRDTNAWYHIVLSVDTTQATSSDRIKMYINGVQETSFLEETYPSQNATNYVNTTTPHYIGSQAGTGYLFDGSMSHIHFIDGTAYDALAFGEFDANGVWKIKTSPSVTYGTNGFFILKDGNSVTDQSGNGNNFTVAGGTLTNTEDNPSNVFATYNPLAVDKLASMSNGNLQGEASSTGSKRGVSTICASSGKYYCEQKVSSLSGSLVSWFGIFEMEDFSNTQRSLSNGQYNWGYENDGTVDTNGSTHTSGVPTYTTGDIIGVALDLDNGYVYFSKNGTFINSGDPTSGSSGTGGFSVNITNNKIYGIGADIYAFDGTTTIQANYGNGYFGTTAVASAGTNASGIGIFEYDVPTGYTALSTKGLNL